MPPANDDDLDLGLDFGRPLLSQQEPPKRRFSVPLPRLSLGARGRKILTVLAVLIVGGGLGGAGFLLTTTSPDVLIGMLDEMATTPVPQPQRLSYPMPSRSVPGQSVPNPSVNGSQPAAGSPGMLTPPTGGHPASGEPPKPEAGKPNAAKPDPTKPDPTKPASAPGKPADAPPALVPPALMPPALMPAAAPVAVPSAPPAIMPQQPTPRASDQAPTYANLPESLAPRKALGSAPIEALVQQTPAGPLPMIAADGRMAWKTHAMPFDVPANKPRLAVLVTGLGLDRDATEAAIAKLPAEVTLVFSPYAANLDKWMKKARDKGHEIMLSLPTEPVGYPANDPGPLGLLRGQDQTANSQMLDKSLAKLMNYVGVLAPDGPFTQSEQLGLVFAACKQRGLLFVGPRLPADPTIPAVGISAEIGLDLFRDAIDAELDRAAALAVQNGSAVVVVTPRPASYARLLVWFDKIHSLGMAVAPIASVVKRTP